MKQEQQLEVIQLQREEKISKMNEKYLVEIPIDQM